MLGRSLGNYGVVSKIGEGGMGVVYLARHVTLGRQAAIKVLRTDLSLKKDIVSRFFNEARAVTAVRHPGIVEVYDFGFLEDHTAYIIMEYLDGESLGARLRRGRPTTAVTLTIVRAITRALQAAHERGIVHRDLKPDNVFLVPDPELPGGERVKLLDFGIAKLAAGVGDASQTTTGTVMGTPTYMSPEQCRGAGSVDHRSDLYSLGCVAYEMLCGQPPFVAAGTGDVLARHLYFEPASPRSHRSDLSPELDALVLRLLKKDPQARYSTAADVVRAIDQLGMAAPPAAGRSTPMPTEFVATLPLVRDTTLNGAASSSEISRRKSSPSRSTLVAAAVTFAIAFLVVIAMFARGSREGETGAGPATAPLTTEPKKAELPGSPPVPTPSAPASPPAAPTAAAAGIAAGTLPGTGTPGGSAAMTDHADEEAATRPDNAQRPAPAGPASAVSPETVTAGGDPTKSAVDASNGAGISDDASKPKDASPRLVPAKPSTARKLKGGEKPMQISTQADPAGPTDFPRWTKTLTPNGTGQTTDPRPSVGSKPPVASTSTGATTSDDTQARGTAPEKPSEPSGATAPRPGESPGGAASSATSGADCTSAAFAAVIDAKTPRQAAVKSALNRLIHCKSMMDPGVYEDIHRRLIEKY